MKAALPTFLFNICRYLHDAKSEFDKADLLF